MAGLVTHDEVVSAAKRAGLIGTCDQARWLGGAIAPPPWGAFSADHSCGPGDVFNPGPIVLIHMPLQRFACADGREAHAYVGRCAKCATAFLIACES